MTAFVQNSYTEADAFKQSAEILIVFEERFIEVYIFSVELVAAGDVATPTYARLIAFFKHFFHRSDFQHMQCREDQIARHRCQLLWRALHLDDSVSKGGFGIDCHITYLILKHMYIMELMINFQASIRIPTGGSACCTVKR